MNYEDNMKYSEYKHYINYQKSLMKSIKKIIHENNIPEFETLPVDYEELLNIYDELICLKSNLYALKQLRNIRYCYL